MNSGTDLIEMRSAVVVSQFHPDLRFLGTRIRASELREKLEVLLANATEVEIDFSGVTVSQFFADELVGVMLLQHGPDILTRLVFKGCSNSVKDLIEFVVADRYDEYMATRAH